jgi:hypothetical protein
VFSVSFAGRLSNSKFAKNHSSIVDISIANKLLRFFGRVKWKQKNNF